MRLDFISRLAFFALTLVVFPSLLLPTIASSQNPHAPVIVDAGPDGCVPRDEVCGDGIDQNCDGVDSLCSGNDADRDGFPQGVDCSDSDRLVYPGVSLACAADCGQGVKTCQANGSFSSCSCSAFCEASGGGKCYYVSKLSGSDSAPGTFNQPLKTTARFNTNGSNPINLQPGDVVYFQSGVYGETVQYFDLKYGLVLRGVNGSANAPIRFKAYPGAHPVFAPTSQGVGFWIWDSSHLSFEGFELARSYQMAIRVSESDNIEFANLWVHDTDGVDNDNIAGISVTRSTNIRIHHSLIHDNYDRTNQDTEGEKTQNSRNIVLFEGGDIRIDHNVIFQSPPTSASKTGGCITYKHAAVTEAAAFEVDNNILWNCFYHAIGGGTSNSYFHHNLILNSDMGFMFANMGGPTTLENNRIEYNTVIGGQAFRFVPETTNNSIGIQRVQHNIFVDSTTYDSNTGGIYDIDTYGPDTRYQAVVGNARLETGDNCFYNDAGSLRFGLFSSNSAAERSLGGLYSLGDWQGFGFDSGSLSVNPQLDAQFRPQTSQCSSKGHYASE